MLQRLHHIISYPKMKSNTLFTDSSHSIEGYIETRKQLYRVLHGESQEGQGASSKVAELKAGFRHC